MSQDRTDDAGVEFTEMQQTANKKDPEQAEQASSTALDYNDDHEQSKCEMFVRRWSGFIVIAIVYVIGVSVVLGCYNSYPKPKSSSVSTREFSEDRANVYLDYLTKTIGERRSNQERNKTAHYIYQQFQRMKEDSEYSDHILTGITNTKVGYVPHVNGLNYTVNNVWLYANLTQRPDSEYILVSAHFDTQPNTVGCNDDALCSITAMELASIYTSYKAKDLKKYNYNILFNVVDGEEGGKFPGARAVFWADTRPPMVNPNTTLGTPRLAYNMESTGKGKHLMYRTNSDWFIREYFKCTPKPFASSIAAAVLEMVAITLGTDASIYAYHTHTLGVASLTDHWVYHTPLDNCDHSLVEGSVQLLGDNSHACLQHFATMEEGEIPVNGYSHLNHLENPTYWADPVNNSDWIIPQYEPNGASLPNNLLFYSILYSSAISIDLTNLTIYHLVCTIIFFIINLLVLFASKQCCGKEVNSILKYDDQLFKFNAKVLGLILANFFTCIFVCLGVTWIMTVIRPSDGQNISCVDPLGIKEVSDSVATPPPHAEGLGHCYETHWRGVQNVFVFTMIILVFLITYLFQFIIAKINQKREQPYNWRTMEKIVYLNNNIFVCIACFLLTVLGQIKIKNKKGKTMSFAVLLHLSYAAFWWSEFCTVGSIILFVLFYTDCIKGPSAKRVLIKELGINLAYICFYIFPALLSFEFVFTMIPIFMGFENFIPVALVGAISGVFIPNIVMTYSSLLQRHIMDIYKYVFAGFGFVFLISFILCCALPGKKMETVIGYQ